MQTWSNLADALIQLAQAHAARGQMGDARAAVVTARAAYVSATSLSESDAGDDLPGLLCNWGTGLTAAGGMLREAGDGAAAVEALRDAVRRLDCSVELQASDIQVCGAQHTARCDDAPPVLPLPPLSPLSPLRSTVPCHV